MVSNPASRAVFVNSVIRFLQQYNFDGLDFDWEYPANRGGIPSDKVCLFILVVTRKFFKPIQLIIDYSKTTST